MRKRTYLCLVLLGCELKRSEVIMLICNKFKTMHYVQYGLTYITFKTIPFVLYGLTLHFQYLFPEWISVSGLFI